MMQPSRTSQRVQETGYNHCHTWTHLHDTQYSLHDMSYLCSDLVLKVLENVRLATTCS